MNIGVFVFIYNPKMKEWQLREMEKWAYIWRSWIWALNLPIKPLIKFHCFYFWKGVVSLYFWIQFWVDPKCKSLQKNGYPKSGRGNPYPLGIWSEKYPPFRGNVMFLSFIPIGFPTGYSQTVLGWEYPKRLVYCFWKYWWLKNWNNNNNKGQHKKGKIKFFLKRKCPFYP